MVQEQALHEDSPPRDRGGGGVQQANDSVHERALHVQGGGGESLSLSGSVRDVSGSRFFFRKKIYPTLSDIKIGAGSTVSGKY